MQAAAKSRILVCRFVKLSLVLAKVKFVLENLCDLENTTKIPRHRRDIPNKMISNYFYKKW